MIKAEDLRIGNIFSIHTTEGFVGCFKLKAESIVIAQNDMEGFLSSHCPYKITEEWMIKFGWQYYNGKTSGPLTKDFPGKLDVDFVDGKIQVKSHYEGFDLYRPLKIEFVHQLQNLWYDFNGEHLPFTDDAEQ